MFTYIIGLYLGGILALSFRKDAHRHIGAIAFWPILAAYSLTRN